MTQKESEKQQREVPDEGTDADVEDAGEADEDEGTLFSLALPEQKQMERHEKKEDDMDGLINSVAALKFVPISVRMKHKR